MAIQILDQNTVMKIAAGEVIENPASVVKELVENSIDAESTSITVEIKDGGKSHIRITDNGVGIAKDEIDLAFARHATSKIHNYDDLFSIYTMGFRGEALASIKAVSEVSVFSKREHDEQGEFVKYVPGEEPVRRTVGHNDGTTIIIENLFTNVPVRAGFLKSALAESNRITDLMYRFAVSHPSIAFKYIKDVKQILKTSGSGIENTLIEIFQSDFYDKLLPITYENETVRMHGYIGKPSLYRGNRSLQYIYVNQRLISEPVLTQLIEQEYTSRIPHSRFPVFFLWVEIDPSAMDVNIHPTKQSVQWRFNTEVFTPLKQVIREALLSDYDRNLFEPKEEPKKHTQLVTLEDYEARKKEEKQEKQTSFNRPTIDKVAETPTLFSYAETKRRIKPPSITSRTTTPPEPQQETLIRSPEVKESPFKSWDYIGTVFSTYLLFEDKMKDEMILCDQHAAHERIHYEQFMDEYERHDVQTQMLLAPIQIVLRPHEYGILTERQTFFEDLGFILAPMSDKAYVLRGIPYLFGELKSPESLVLALIDTIDNAKHSQIEDFETKVIKRACVASVKAGESLQKESIDALMEQLAKTKEPFTCPHGRPTFVRMNRNDLHKLFQRISS